MLIAIYKRFDVVELARDRHRLVGKLDARLDPSVHQGVERFIHAELCAKRRIWYAFEHPLRLSDPACADGARETPERLVREVGRDPPRVLGAAGILVACECALEGLDGCVGLSGPPCRGPQQFEIVGSEAAVLVRGSERLHRLGPRVAADGVPAALDGRDHLVVRTGYLGRGLRATDSDYR